jgi:AbrB family looped-hinge helix DNA binding protein
LIFPKKGITITGRSNTMKITSKGQVTIPMEIRDKFGFLPNTEVEFVESDGRVILKKAEPSLVMESPFTYVRGTSDLNLSTEEIMKLTRKGE